LLLLCVSVSIPIDATAQSVFKCRQGNAVTYSNTPCEKLGLKSGGEVRDRITTVPGTKPQSAPAAAHGAGGKLPPGTIPGNEIDMPKSSTIKPVNPMIEKLLK
jgi:hypothetical protein